MNFHTHTPLEESLRIVIIKSRCKHVKQWALTMSRENQNLNIMAEEQLRPLSETFPKKLSRLSYQAPLHAGSAYVFL